ncbi:MAG: class I SAM-dependent methyltransferase [Ferruginibacter sp.]
MSKGYIDKIVKHYENCLQLYGDTHRGVDWPNEEDVRKRYKVMLDIVNFDNVVQNKPTLLDFGCGAAHIVNYISEKKIEIKYTGLDISEKFIALCRQKYPTIPFYCTDILVENIELPRFDFVIMNGVFTEKREMSFEEMWQYFCEMILKVFNIANRGVAFNVMSKAVAWERNDLFHLPTDMLIDFLTKNLSRHFIIRNDYGLYEYTTYVYK